MFELFKRETMAAGSVLFRGNLPPRPQEFDYLRKLGVEIRPGSDHGDAHWSLELRHKDWGDAKLVALRGAPAPPRQMLTWYAALTDEERDLAAASASSVSISVNSKKKNVLRDRKHLLRFARSIMGGDGVLVADHTSQLFWSRSMLDDELAHDADLDITAIYCVHAVGANEPPAEGEEPTIEWLHTHGLAELGAFDFDILAPSPAVCGTSGEDLQRALAYAIVEGTVKVSTASFNLALPGGVVSLVPVGEFNQSGHADDLALRTMDKDHSEKRSVICEPRGKLSSFLRSKVRRSRFFADFDGEDRLLQFSSAASELMSKRAQATIGVFAAAREELVPHNFPCIAKIAYPTAGGSTEHLWFNVHGVEGRSIDAELVSEPFDIPTMKAGQRGMHPVAQLSDWMIITPLGHITPRSMHALRTIRRDPESLKAMIAIMKLMGGGEG